MKLVPTLAWTLSGEAPSALDARLLPLLAGVRKHASLTGAAAAIGMPYRSAWALIRAWQARLGTALVRLERGRGAALAPLGEQLLRTDEVAAQHLERVVDNWTVELSVTGTLARRKRLRIAASHDLALARVRDSITPSTGLDVDFQFLGSIESLDHYARRKADLAGCHVPAGSGGAEARAVMLARFRSGRDALIGFIEREQGFIVQRGNPHRLRGFADIARKRLRFVNRQRGSGTRVLVDLLLRDSRVEPAQITGYRNEEFTHVATAATVASGGADAAFGLRAAAAQFGLGFVPVLREHYVLVWRRQRLQDRAVVALRAVLQSTETAALVRSLAGYRLWHAGEIVPLSLLAQTGNRSRARRIASLPRVAAK